ncbi:MAG: hypothetical protein RMY29_014490 [Nostoc sp. CreGUA01]
MNSEVTSEITHPDPACDYYVLWHELRHVTARIDVVLKIISDKETANDEVNKQIKQILQPTLDELTSIVERLPYDEDEE